MDRQTLAAYDQDAVAYAKDWLGQPSPVDLQEVVERFFVRGGTSADIGCGCGREVAWLHANGFSAVGFDASDGLLNEARQKYPSLKFAHAELPELRGIGTFDNVLCETVIMHLDREQMGLSGRKNRREPDAGNVIRHDHQARHRLPCPLHATHASEVFGLKISEPVRPIAQRRFDDS